MEFLLPLLITLPPAAYPIIGLSLAIGVLLVALAYMVAYALQSAQMIALAKEELAALVFTAFIILFWLSFDTILNGLVSGTMMATLPEGLGDFATSTSEASGGLNEGHIHLAIGSLEILEQKLRESYIDLYLFEALIGFLSTISFPLGSPLFAVNIISFSLAPFTGLTLLSAAHTTVVESVGYLIMVVWAKWFIVVFARDSIPLFLLPLGIVLRAFPILRRTGSSLIAMSFAFYFVFPLSVILSNYLIFDVFEPADFAYTPASASFFDTDQSQRYYQEKIDEGRDAEHGPAHELFERFRAPSVVEQTYQDPLSGCVGNIIVRFYCSAKSFFTTAASAVWGFISTIWTIWKFMMGMTGDFFKTAFNNPLMPASASAGLYYFIIREVSMVSPLLILVMVMTVMEIVITVTTYRNISILIGGEAELIGLTKIV